MKQDTIRTDQWHELTDEQKEIVRTWAVSEDIGLEIVNSKTAETCDYAALLTRDQLLAFLKSRNIQTNGETVPELWDLYKKSLM